MRIVSKFGGSSMADAMAMKRSAQVAYQKQSSIVVVSATYGTTNQLIQLSQLAVQGNQAQVDLTLKEIVENHKEIAYDLNINDSDDEHGQLAKLLGEVQTLAQGILLLKDLSPKAQDRLLGLGERLSSLLFARALKDVYKGQKEVSLFDVKAVMKTDNKHTEASPLIDQIKVASQKTLIPRLENGEILVTQGFIGCSPEGLSTTLGRGGSDYSAALLAEASEASLLEIWTDVAGIATTDPRLCTGTKLIDEMSFMEASELAVFGAKILHPTTLQPTMRAQIPVFVGSSIEPEKPGTWIRPECQKLPLVRAMALRSSQGLLTLTTPKMLHHHGFLYRVFEVFERHKISVDSVTTSEISVSITLDEKELCNQELIHDLEQHAQVDIERDLCLVSLIGNRINHTAGLSRQIFKALGDDINVRMICLGASRHNFCFLVDQKNGSKAIQQLHQHFIQESGGLS
jgi:aspartate kinase